MSMITKILLILSIILIALFLLFSIIAIYNKVIKNNYNKWFSKESLILIIL